ncbi:putative transcriptional regulator, GntR Family [Bosea sp. LC85]|uniref:GntR family transcriptional regulator n=1 Tax=Bosea sp. LC85 TaxID=1502851 RepID=UPI0004E3A557|nr:GntR family transcriptional regulator [Bosea sp. LC85]KFC61585.1 putative transcriptional regulator, GntR Family [Bosea sp. LC85]
MNALIPNQIRRPRDVVYESLKRQIMLNELRPESALTELGMAREHGCSQGTIREALLRLQEDGLVTRSGHRGTMVTRLDPEEAEEILALRRRIEIRGALRAVQHVERDSLERLYAIQADMDAVAAAGDEYALIMLDMAFHLTIFRLSGLDALEQILTRCTLHSHRSKLWAPGHRRPLAETAARHRSLVALLEARDGEGLSRAMADHIDTIVLRDGAA